MNVSATNSYNYSYTSLKSTTIKQTVSAGITTAKSIPTPKVLGYEVDKDGYFKSDFNKAAGIPEDFKIHSDTMKSLVNMNETAYPSRKLFSHIDIAKTAGNAYNILTQIMDKETLNKDKFTREDLIAMPQGYEYNIMSLKVSKIHKSAAEYMGSTTQSRGDNERTTTTFYNRSVMNYWNSPQGGRLSPSTNIFDSNTGGKEQPALYFNTTADKYTNSDGSVTKGGLLVGVMHHNFHTWEGETTFRGKMSGFDKHVSAKEAQLQDKMFWTMFGNRAINVPDSLLESLPEDFKQHVIYAKRRSRALNGHYSSSEKKTPGFEQRSPAQILFESIAKMQKEMLESLKEKAKKARIEHQKALNQNLLNKQDNQRATESLQEFTHFFLTIQEKLNNINNPKEKSDITEDEFKKAFLNLFSNHSMQKSFLDVSA